MADPLPMIPRKRYDHPDILDSTRLEPVMVERQGPVMEPADDIGRMAAEAAQAQWEATAQAVEEMGEEIKVRIEKLAAELADCSDTMKLIEEAAKAVREKGRVTYIQIEESSMTCRDMRDALAALRKKAGV